MPPRGDLVRKPGRPTNELQARTNEDKGRTGKDRLRKRTGYGQGYVSGRMVKTGQGQGQDTGRMGKGEKRAGMVNSWMLTHPGKSCARTPGQKWHSTV